MKQKIRYRSLAMLLALCMAVSNLPVYAADNTDSAMQETIETSENEAVDSIGSEESDKGIEEIITEESSQDNVADMEETVSGNGTEGEKNTDIQELTEEELEGGMEDTEGGAAEAGQGGSETVENVTVNNAEVVNNAEYQISGSIKDITNKSAVFSYDIITRGYEGETVYAKIVYYSKGREQDTYVTKSISSPEVGECSLTELYADMDYTVWAALYKDSSYTEELAKTEELTFHTLQNEVDYKSEVTFTEVTDSSLTVNILPSDDKVSVYEELQNQFYVYIYIDYRIAGSDEDYVSIGVPLQKQNGYAHSLELTNLRGETEYEVRVRWPALGDSGKEVSYQTVTTSKRLNYNFTVNGDRIGQGLVHFEITSGYMENEEFILDVYRTDSNGEKILVCIGDLNAGNNYKFESTQGTLEEWDVEYTFHAELKKRDDQGYIRVNVLHTDQIIKKVEKIKVFDLSLVEDSVTYVTAKVDVKWVNPSYMESDEIEIWLETATGGSSSGSITLKKGEKEQAVAECFDLEPGTTYDLHVTMVINGQRIVFWENVSFTTKGYTFEPIGEIKTPSQMEIVQKWKELGIDLNKKDTFEREVNHTDGGLLSSDTLQNATDLTNFIRYVVGLPADLIYDEEWSSICNAGSEINRLNGTLSHYPAKPDGVTEEFYQRGYKGTSSSNLSWGRSNLTASVLSYMRDDGESNISKGHRTWILSPGLSVSGFGSSGGFRSMYVMARSNREGAFDKGYCHWPAANTPVEIYSAGDPSLYLSSEYDTMNKEDITIRVVSKALGKEWTFTGEEGNYSDGCYSRIYNSHTYGGWENYIVFGVGDFFPKGDEVTVTVTGTTINGVDAPITYTMNFFSIQDIEVQDVLAESITISSNTTEVMENKSIQMRAKILPENTTNKNVLWSVESADGKGQAEITKDGILTGKVEGLVKVTAACESNPSITASADIRVRELMIPVESLVLSRSSLRLEKGSRGYISVTLEPANTTENEVSYVSADPGKVSVANGYIHALDVTEEPVAITVSAGDIQSTCLVEVYEVAEDSVDKNYDTRLTDIKLSGESNVLVGQTQLIKWYPVTNGQELTSSEYEIVVSCNEKYLSIEPISSEDNGRWYRLTGSKKGKQTVTVKMTSKVEGNINPETVKKSFTFTVNSKSEEDAAIATAPVLAKNNITINQNTVLGTALDIRAIEGNSEIRQVYLASMAEDGTENLFSIQEDEGVFYIQTREIGANKKYKLILHIHTEQGKWEYPLTVTTKKSFPGAAVKQTQKPNIQILTEDAVLKITGKEEIEKVTFHPNSSDFYQKSTEGTGKEYCITIGQAEHDKKLNKKGTVEILFKGYRQAYTKKITLATVSKTIKSHTLVSDIKKITLNSTECGGIPAAIKMSLINSMEKYPLTVFVEGTGNKAKKMLQSDNIYFTYNKKTGVLNAFVKEGTTQGTYGYRLTGYAMENEKVVNTAGTVTISVVVATAKPALSLKASGSINLIARSDSCVTYIPTVRNYSGSIASVELEGEDASKFYARVGEDGKIRIYAREKAMIYPKSSYYLEIKATLTNGYECDSVRVKIVPKQSSFKVAVKQHKITLYRNEANGYPIDISVKSPAASRIAYIKAVTVPEGITYNSDNQTIKITESGKVKAGKTYKLVFEVTPKGAYRSIKPAKVTIQVKVK